MWQLTPPVGWLAFWKSMQSYNPFSVYLGQCNPTGPHTYIADTSNACGAVSLCASFRCACILGLGCCTPHLNTHQTTSFTLFWLTASPTQKAYRLADRPTHAFIFQPPYSFASTLKSPHRLIHVLIQISIFKTYWVKYTSINVFKQTYLPTVPLTESHTDLFSDASIIPTAYSPIH